VVLALFGNSVTVSEAKDTVDDLVSLQKGLLETLHAERRRLKSGIRRSETTLSDAVNEIVIVNNDARYRLLTDIAQSSGVEESYIDTVNQWREADKENRSEKASLEKEWGSKQEVGDLVVEIREELDVTKSANSEVSEEITAWDETTQAIDTHNEKYPKAQITEENHDGYEEFKWGRWFSRYTLGLIFNKYAGPHEAYKIIGPYNESFGDYYEDRLNIYQLHQTQLDIQEKQNEEQAKYDELSSIHKRMEYLDNAYMGPKKIASLIGDWVKQHLLERSLFTENLLDRLETNETLEAVNAVTRLKGYAQLEPYLKKIEAEAEETVRELEEPNRVLTEGNRVVPYESFTFNFAPIIQKLDHARDDFNKALDKVATSRAALDNLSASNSELLEYHLSNALAFNISVPDRTFDLSELENDVKREIEAEEARQEAARRRAEELAEAAREAALAASRRQQNKVNDVLTSSRRARSNNAGKIFTSNNTRRSSKPAGIFGANNTRR
jgi:hypothetical protein